MRTHDLHLLRGIDRQQLRRQVQWLLHRTARWKKQITLSVFLGLCTTALRLLAGLLSRTLIDAAVARELHALLLPGCFYIAAQLTRAALGAGGRYLSAVLRVRAENDLRADLFESLLDARWQDARQYHPGELIDRIQGDVSAAAAGVLGWIPSLMTCLAQLAAALGLCLYFDPLMALLVLLCGAALLLGRGCVRRIRALNAQRRTAQAELTAFYEETFHHYTAVKAMDRKRQRLHRLAQLQARLLELTRARERFSVFTGLISAALMLPACGVLGWGLVRMWRAQLGYGTLALMLQLAFLVCGAFRELVALVPFAVSVTVATERILAIAELPAEDCVPGERAAQLAQQAGGVRILLSQVDFSYERGAPVLRGATLTASPGEIVGIVGASGSGKTTLLRLLMGLVSPTGGEVLLRRGACEAQIEPSLRCLCSYVPQENTLFSGSVADNLRLYRENATDDDLTRALHDACADEFVFALSEGADTPVGPGETGLSEGQRQRLAIAGALLSESPVLLFDEATSALDVKTEAQVMRRIRAVLHDRTALFTTHRPGVLQYCDRVYCLRSGQLTELTQQEIVNFAQWALIE